MPAILPSASKTVHGSMVPDARSPSRRSISLRMSSGFGTKVYQSFHSSPSFTAFVSPSQWSCDKGFSCACGPLSETGSSQGIGHPFPSSRGALHLKRVSKDAATIICSWFETRRKRDAPHHDGNRELISSLVQKIQGQAGPRPVHRDEFALAGQRDVGGLEVRPAEGDIGGDAIAGRHPLDDGTVRRNHRDAARDQGRHADIA